MKESIWLPLIEKSTESDESNQTENQFTQSNYRLVLAEVERDWDRHLMLNAIEFD